MLCLRNLLKAFFMCGFIINTISLLLLQFEGKKRAPEISHDSNPYLTNPRQQRYNSAFLNERSPFCMLLFVAAMIAIYLGGWTKHGEDMDMIVLADLSY